MEGTMSMADAAAVRSRRGNRPPGWLVLGVGGAVTAVVLLAVMLLRPDSNVGEGSPTSSPTPPASAAETPTASPSEPPPTATATTTPATPVPTPARADLAWTLTASFPASGGLSMVEGVARLGDGYVAVGVEYLEELPVFGPTPPHEARAWTSLDGRSWEPVALGPGFENVRFGPLIQRGDGSFLSLGERGIVSEFGINESAPAAWTTTDGLTWNEIDPPLEGFVDAVEQGATGVLAIVRPSVSTDVHEFWLSADGGTWERVHMLEAAYVDIGAGDEGFAAVGWIGNEDGSPFAIASADGRTWIDGPTPQFGQFLEVASFGGDWVVVDDPGGIAPTWFSANGLDWAAHGEVPLQTISAGEGECREYRSQLTSARPWIVTTSELAYPCSESGFMVHGTQYLSIDGAAWSPMPLTEGTPGENRSGSRVNDALATDGGLIMVGEENGGAAFWFGEAP
jgi:hypothetical protein